MRVTAIRLFTYLRHPVCIMAFLGLLSGRTETRGQTAAPLRPLLRAIDLDVGDTKRVTLHDGSTAEVTLQAVQAVTDPVLDAVRGVRVTVRVNGEEKTIHSGNYHLPITVGGVQIDCPVTQEYMKRAHADAWGLEQDARLRLWPANSPYIWPGTLVYPVSQKWLASYTQYSNEPVLGSQRPGGKIYYHSGLDFGGAEGMVDVFAATDGLVVSVRGEVLSGEDEPDNPIKPRYDVVYVRDARGWYYRYSHFDAIVPDLRVGQRVRAGQKLGILGKEGGSGGWSHLHFEIKSRQPSGKWGTQESYAFVWQAYRRQYDPKVLAVARPHAVIQVGDTATLQATNSWAAYGIQRYEWTLSDGSTPQGAQVKQVYQQPGTYSEIVKVTDSEGNHDYDFAVVKVFVRDSNPEETIPNIHATFYPTRAIEPGERVFFQVRSQWITEGYDVWDFGDGGDTISVKSNIDTDDLAPGGYAITSHRFEKPGDYLVKVARKTPRGTATARLYVRVKAP